MFYTELSYIIDFIFKLKTNTDTKIIACIFNDCIRLLLPLLRNTSSDSSVSFSILKKKKTYTHKIQIPNIMFSVIWITSFV